MKFLSLCAIALFAMIQNSGCTKGTFTTQKRNLITDTSIIGKWECIGYFDIFFMGPEPAKRWISYKTDDRFSYNFKAEGVMSYSGKAGRCQYNQYLLKNSTLLELYSPQCDTTQYSILKLTTDSLYLSTAWYEDQYIYVFSRVAEKDDP
ncbi:MAG: hypothetical protein ACRDE2_02125 [Chitinophagaceae bacterium]